MLLAELEQCHEEGTVVPPAITRRIHELHPVHDAWNLPKIDSIWTELDALPRKPELDNDEPNDLAKIRAITKKTRPEEIPRVRTAQLRQQINGAWRGRLAGCALGLPYERLGCAIEAGRNVGMGHVQDHLKSTSNFPMIDFAKSMPDKSVQWGSRSLSSTINGMEPDDDIHYTIANLCIFEEKGSGFAWQDVADWWLSNLPLTEFCTAEVQALLNYASFTARWGSDGGDRSVASPEFTRRYRNPYREWIGAQIRSDFWGWVSPLDPYQASDFAYRDSHWTHERNGIYGAMFFSALQALAFGCSDLGILVTEALSFVPPKSRFAITITRTLEVAESCSTWQEALNVVQEHLTDSRGKDMSPVHTLNNAAICVLSLLFGTDDPFHAARLAVMSGLDTDCNGATVGATLGVIHGDALSDLRLVKRIGDTVDTRISTSPQLHVPNLVDRTINAALSQMDCPNS